MLALDMLRREGFANNQKEHAMGTRALGQVQSELAEAIAKIMAMSASQRRAMGMAGRARVIDSYTSESQARRLSQLVEAA